MSRHGPIHQLNLAVRIWDAVLEALLVGVTISTASLIKIILWHPCENIPQLSGHGSILCNIGHQSNPTEEANENIKGPLNPLRVPQSDEATIRI